MREFLILLIILLSACSSMQPRQGIKGQVLWASGNQMPGPGSKKSSNYGVQRELHVYELTTIKEVTMSSDGFFSGIKTKLVTIVTTQEDGTFTLHLPAGEYSIFVKEDNGLYANRFDQNNSINPIIIKEKEFAWLPITINYQATY
ncbi:MAG TPA: carboxypeptidase regulatory-like domain-containing protein [Cyclobacteriaceae bacterium]|nr:carboxypeptidase regulatory-like domain-containing protein [Cyclobacteriaceae bacterium]HRK53172.1 carboxypeptidase regulatory-like domain-containing protein [Cyclobacteriaceae bacterium]